MDCPPSSPQSCLTHSLILRFFLPPRPPISQYFEDSIPLICKWGLGVGGGGVQTMISTIKPFISKYNWKEMKNSSGKNAWKTFEKNNPTIALHFKTQLK